MRSDRPRLQKAAALRELIADLLHRQGLAAKVEECRAWLAWDDAVGPQIAAHARPIRVRDGVLEVRVDQPVWMQQLQLLKPKILAKLNTGLPEPIFRDIFWRRGRLEPKAAAEENQRQWPSPPLSREEEVVIETTVANLHDPELRQGLRELLRRQARLTKGRKS